MLERLTSDSLLPVVVIDDLATATPLAEALSRAGLTTIEVTMRTPAALEAVRMIRTAVPEVLVGAGTVLTASQAHEVVAAGAQFLVSPGLHRGVVDAAQDLDKPIFPGVATATEVQQAWNMGLRVLKFFPAEQLGGVAMLNAFASVFPEVRFIPTGGIAPDNVDDYLRSPAVIACGGSWLAPRDALGRGDFDEIEKRAREAIRIAHAARAP